MLIRQFTDTTRTLLQQRNEVFTYYQPGIEPVSVHKKVIIDSIGIESMTRGLKYIREETDIKQQATQRTYQPRTG